MHAMNSAENLLWVTDPWTTLAHPKDTTLRLAEEAANLGIPTWWSASDWIFRNGDDTWLAAPVQAGPLRTESAFLPDRLEAIPASSFRQIHDRLDPPVNGAYIETARRLDQARGAGEGLLNPFDLITGHSEKLPLPDLLHLAPKHVMVRLESDFAAAIEFVRDRREFVSKPMNLAQSIGVRRHATPDSDEEIHLLIERICSEFSGPVLLQEYLPGVNRGEIRLWFAMGTFVAALKKHPLPGDFRVLIDAGSKVEACFLSGEQLQNAEEIGASLRKNRIALAAVDLISDRISDFNITSPGLLVQLEEVHGRNFAGPIIRALWNGF